MKFLSNVLAVILGLMIFSVISFILFAGLITLSTAEEKVTISDNTVLHINLENIVLVERTSEDNIDLSSFGPIPAAYKIGLANVKKAIRTAKENNNIKGIYLQAGTVMANPAVLTELRNELIDFSESGKFIVSYSELYSEGGYFLSSAASEIYLNPMGGLEFNGLSSEILFFKGMLEKLEIEPVIFRVGEFKSAVEPFILDQMSDANRLQTESFLGDMNDYMIRQIAESRSLTFDTLKKANDQMLVREPQDAADLGLVDGIWYDDQVKDLLREKLGLEADAEITTINISGINKTAKTKNLTASNRIAVIVAEGEIVSGKVEGTISSEIFAQEIKKARMDDDIKAIVLRVNSPGGSVLASEVIWREMNEAKKVKPVIASMSSLAASGGYYISTPADTIVAQPNTITGSIGIFGMWFNAEGLLNNKLGITTDVAKTGEFSDFMNPTRQLSEVEKNIIQKQIEDGYDTFITRVADGRKMSKEAVMEVASGRVWSGRQAKENGLVDILGGLDDAIQIAANKADVGEDYRVLYYPKQKTILEQIMTELGTDIEARYMNYRFGNSYRLLEKIENIQQMKGINARLPFDIKVK
ncbi:signal peptide peptidase SppA [Echinicola vietnamensis]|uniref:Signal peptide peptidase SppA, 67K type n=1 Tax=Echinicola vietnamensis (strain DSM 17526 / LMG 23754 / KMM 6221) TaxID=926556 RepID=L0G0G9_ECHVK|nr:signal peptide peptidase SppA [Echinicola vietnamensis]AGA79022.1 signal peptide peptidase SppA, 67K type [Echinicola vietnamensis DSM 17526]